MHISKRLVALGAACAVLAPAAGVAIAHQGRTSPSSTPTSAQCTELKQQLAQHAAQGAKAQPDSFASAQIAACDHAYGGDKGNPPAGPNGSPPDKTSGPSGVRQDSSGAKGK